MRYKSISIAGDLYVASFWQPQDQYIIRDFATAESYGAISDMVCAVSMNHQGLRWNVHCVPNVALRIRLNLYKRGFKIYDLLVPPWCRLSNIYVTPGCLAPTICKLNSIFLWRNTRDNYWLSHFRSRLVASLTPCLRTTYSFCIGCLLRSRDR